MRPEERDPAHLWDILEAAKVIVRYCGGKTIEDYRRDQMLRDAVERQFILLGEAARRLSDDFRSAKRRVPLAAHYRAAKRADPQVRKIDESLIWQHIQEDVPRLIGGLTPLLPEAPSEPSV
jgi:uncharacterized protein with HEPN domain